MRRLRFVGNYLAASCADGHAAAGYGRRRLELLPNKDDVRQPRRHGVHGEQILQERFSVNSVSPWWMNRTRDCATTLISNHTTVPENFPNVNQIFTSRIFLHHFTPA